MQNSTQGGFVCCTVLDVFNLCTQVLRALYSQNIHFIYYGDQTKNTDSEQFSELSLSASKMHVLSSML